MKNSPAPKMLKKVKALIGFKLSSVVFTMIINENMPPIVVDIIGIIAFMGIIINMLS